MALSSESLVPEGGSMNNYCRAIMYLIFLIVAEVQAADFSTLVLKPTPLGPEGGIEATFPPGGGSFAYYFTTTIQKGELLTQIFFKGQPGREKRVELALLDANANLISAYWIQGVETQNDAIRSFPIAEPGRQLLRITVSGPETDEFRVTFGGSAFPQPASASATATPTSATP